MERRGWVAQRCGERSLVAQPAERSDAGGMGIVG